MIDYWYWESFFSLKELKDINKICETHKVKNYEDVKAEYATKTSLVSGVHYKDIKDKINNAYQEIISVNNENFGYNLFNISDLQILNFNKYNSKQKSEYSWHCDSSNNHINDIKFTFLINTSLKKYKGGEFYFFFGRPVTINAFNKPGSMILFKSFLHHKVSPVIKGERSSLAMFLKGPKFV